MEPWSGSKWSLWSENSLLSIGSRGSVLSLGEPTNTIEARPRRERLRLVCVDARFVCASSRARGLRSPAMAGGQETVLGWLC